ncbi:MAG: hypothetical protein JNM98_21600 [Rhodocyclaceae bacterium]|nr:hypothetical protein [Rhodocyclaceae bacterium]
MRIGSKQMEQLDRSGDERLRNALFAYLRNEQTVWVENSPDDELRQRIEWGIRRARWHGMTWESSIMKFVGLMFRIAPNFDEYPPIAALLARTDVAPDQLADLLFSEISGEQWEAAMERYDPAAWEFDE